MRSQCTKDPIAHTRLRQTVLPRCQQYFRLGWLRFFNPCRPGWVLAWAQALAGVNQIQTAKFTPPKLATVVATPTAGWAQQMS